MSRTLPVVSVLHSALLGVLFTGILAPATRAQQPAAEAAAPSAAARADLTESALLARAIAKMASVTGVQLKTLEVHDNAMLRQFRAHMAGGIGIGEDIEVEGTWCQGVLAATAGNGDEVVRCRGRTVARVDGEWKLRGATLPNGGAMPFLFDPQLFFEWLAALRPEALAVAHAEEGKRGDVAVRVLSATLEGDAARDLLLAGVFPAVGGGGPMIMLGGGAAASQGDVTVDLAMHVDPDSALVHRVRVKAYEESPFAGHVQIAGGGGDEKDEGADEEKDVRETDAQGNRIYKGGLPVRKLGDSLSMVDFDVTLSKHDQTFAVDLDQKARRLLKLDAPR